MDDTGGASDTGATSDTGDGTFIAPRDTERRSVSDAQLVISNTAQGGRVVGAELAGDLTGDGAPEVVAWGKDALSAEYVFLLDARQHGPVEATDGITLDIGYIPEIGILYGVHGRSDLTGDGVMDLVVSADEQLGGILIAPGPIQLSSSMSDIAGANFVVAGSSPEAQVFAVGDNDGDGVDDLLAVVYTQREGAFVGLAVLGGPLSGDLTPEDADATRSTSPTSLWGNNHAAGGTDLDGDGYDDFVLTTDYLPEGDEVEQVAWVFHGPIEGDGAFTDADATLLGAEGEDGIEGPVATAEGAEEGARGLILLGDEYFSQWDSWGAALLVDGGVGGTVELDAEARIVGGVRCEGAGQAVAFLRGEGGPGAVVGAPGLVGGDCPADSSRVGMAWTPLKGNLRLEDSDLQIESGSAMFGTLLSGAFDVDEDGADDLAVSDTYHVWLFTGLL